MKPREFWILRENVSYGAKLEVNPYPGHEEGLFGPEEAMHVREVVELKTEEIEKQKEVYATKWLCPIEYSDLEEAFEAGARWAIARMKGE